MHHIVSDGWSMGVFLRELTLYYQAQCQGEAAPLPPLPVQYADFAAWQRTWLDGARFEEQLAYWKEQLANPPAVLELPADRPRPAYPTFAGATLPVELTAELTEALRRLSRAEGVTLYMTILAAFQAWLGRLTGQDDICVGSPIANRRQVEIEGLIGFFVNTLVLRTSLAGEPTFRELLARVRETTLGAYAHQDLPFEKLVEVLAPQRSRSHAPLFQVALVLQNAPLSWPATAGLELTSQSVDNGTAKYDLTLLLSEEAGRLVGQIEFSTELFEASTIECLFTLWQQFLQGVVADPTQPLWQVPLLSAQERQQLLIDWNHTEAAYPAERLLHELIAEQAQQAPQRMALVDAHTSLTYAQLEARANQLAWHLQALGVGPEAHVGVCLERSVELVVALVAISKAGGAYIPLDPAYPPSRLAFVLEDSQCGWLITQTSLVDHLPTHAAQPVLLDRIAHELAAQPTNPPPCTANPRSLAYMIFTSGSTGKPKGVQIEQRSLSRIFVAPCAANQALGPAAAYCQFDLAEFRYASFGEIHDRARRGGNVVSA